MTQLRNELLRVGFLFDSWPMYNNNNQNKTNEGGGDCSDVLVARFPHNLTEKYGNPKLISRPSGYNTTDPKNNIKNSKNSKNSKNNKNSKYFDNHNNKNNTGDNTRDNQSDIVTDILDSSSSLSSTLNSHRIASSVAQPQQNKGGYRNGRNFGTTSSLHKKKTRSLTKDEIWNDTMWNDGNLQKEISKDKDTFSMFEIPFKSVSATARIGHHKSYRRRTDPFLSYPIGFTESGLNSDADSPFEVDNNTRFWQKWFNSPKTTNIESQRNNNELDTSMDEIETNSRGYVFLFSSGAIVTWGMSFYIHQYHLFSRKDN